MKKNEKFYSRKLYIIGSIDMETYERFSRELDELLAVDDESPIHVEISSCGGEDDAAFAFFGRIRNAPCPMHMHAYGAIQSAAVLVFAAGDIREAHMDTMFMVHESDAELSGKTSENIKESNVMQIMENRFNSLMENRTGIDKKIWARLAYSTTYFYAVKAVSLGLVTKIMA